MSDIRIGLHLHPPPKQRQGPRMLRLAGQVGDQVLIGTGLTPEIVEASLLQLHEGAKAAGRDPADLEVWWAPRLSIAENRANALKDVKAAGIFSRDLCFMP